MKNKNDLCNANNTVRDLLDFIEEEKQRRTKTSGFFKNGELQDKQIVKALHQAAEDYENGEIIETKDVLIEIINAITDFENCQK